MTTVATIAVKLDLNSKGYQSGLDSAEKKTRGFGASMGSVMGGIGKVAAIGLGAVAAGAGLAAVALSKTIGPASDLGESINAASVIFGDAKDAILDYGKTASETVGLSNREFNQLATTTGAFLQNVGFNAAGAAQETITLTERAADMASVFNTDVDQALGAIQSGLKGEFNPLEQFGVKINAAAIDTYALTHGLAANKDQLTDTIKAQASLALIYEQTEKTAGDFLNTSDSLANVQRRLSGRFEDLKAKIGAGLMPIIEKLGGILLDVLAKPEVMAAIDGLVAGLSNAGMWLGSLIDNFGGFKPPEKLIEIFNFLANWWAIHGPGITKSFEQLRNGFVNGFEQMRAKIEPFIQVVLGKLIVWFAENGPLIESFIQAIADAFTNYIIPAVVGAWDLISPLLMGIIDIILDLATLIMQVATGDWTGAWETIQNIAKTAISAVVDAINVVIGWINQLGANLGSIELPDWLTPGSPTPFELGLRGIGDALRSVARQGLPELQAGLQLSAVGVPAGGSDGGMFGAMSQEMRNNRIDEGRLARAIVDAMLQAGA